MNGFLTEFGPVDISQRTVIYRAIYMYSMEDAPKAKYVSFQQRDTLVTIPTLELVSACLLPTLRIMMSKVTSS